MSTRPSATPTPGITRRRTGRPGAVAVLSALAVPAVLLAACSSTPKAATTTTAAATTTTAAVSLSSLENWPTTTVALQETGSSLLYPLFNLWTAQIQKEWPSVSITTASTGSGTGISSAAAGTVNIGASDAYLSPAEMQQYPGLENIPLAISAQQINYNLPGVTGNLKLDGPTLAAIYQGKITKWNDAKIAALNPGVTLPDMPIVTVHRSDSSGDTFLFSSFLTASDPSGWTIPPGTTVAWPAVPGAVAAMGNGGMVQACKASPGCIAYIGVSYLSKATAAGLGYAALKNKSGNFELPTQAAIGVGGGQLRQLHSGERGGLDDLRPRQSTATRSSTTSTPSCRAQQPSALGRPGDEGGAGVGHRPQRRQRVDVSRPGQLRGPAQPGGVDLRQAHLQGQRRSRLGRARRVDGRVRAVAQPWPRTRMPRARGGAATVRPSSRS